MSPSDSDFEEFLIEIAREYAEEAQPLEQRDFGIFGHARTRRLNASCDSSRLSSTISGGFMDGRRARNNDRAPAGGEPLDSAVAMLR